MSDEYFTRLSSIINNIPPDAVCYWEIGEEIYKDLTEHIGQRYTGIETLFGYPIKINTVDKNVARLWKCEAEL